MPRLLIACLVCIVLIACGGEEKKKKPTGAGTDGTGQPAPGPSDVKPAEPGAGQPDVPKPPPPTPEELQQKKRRRIERLMKSSDEDNRLEAVSLLAELTDKEDAAHLATKLLTDESADLRETAVRLIVDLDYRDGVSAIKTLLHRDENALVRKVALQSIFKLTRGKATSELIQALRRDDDDSVKALAATLLGETTGEQTGKALIEALEEFDPGVRRNALASIQKVRPKGAAETIIGLLEDMSLEVRTEAARTLGVLGDEKAVGPLIAFLSEEDGPQTLTIATDALAALTGRANTFDERADSAKREAAIKAWKDWYESNK